MSKRVAVIIMAAGLAAAFAVYALAAFVAWSWSPSSWAFEGRLFCALGMFMAGAMAAAAATELAA